MSASICSIIIPVYNGAQYISATIESCLAQDHPFIEIILVDDHSTDKSLDVLHTYEIRYPESIKIIRHSENQGLAQSILSGITQAKGQYIAVIGHDDLMLSNRISFQVACIEKYSVSMVCTNALFLVDEELTSNLVNPKWLRDGYIRREAFLFNNPVIGPSVLFSKDDFQKISPSIFIFKNSMEWIHWLQYTAMDGIYYIAQPLTYYRRHLHNLSSSLFKTDEYKNYRKYCRKFAWRTSTIGDIIGAFFYKILRQPPIRRTR